MVLRAPVARSIKAARVEEYQSIGVILIIAVDIKDTHKTVEYYQKSERECLTYRSFTILCVSLA